MASDRWAAVEQLYHDALARAASERAAFLAEACAGDVALRQEVESLLAQAASGDFLGEPAIAMAAQMASAPDVSQLTGRRIGVYELRALLGAGGMGEVYRARDTKLGRDVAIKILPAAFTSDPGRLARFEREARVLATLNHPHIGAIYGFEEADPSAGSGQVAVRALVLELVEGETLADRIARGALPIAEALTIARQIADALDAAHEKGIVHRDLKPANIKITPDGVVKVLDFGLAKLDTGGSAEALSQSPTVTVGGTRDGIILGTAAYMSPEQARGQAVDKRTDVWAFGCVLYEMLTGRAAFRGATVSDVIAALIERDPEWTALPSATPSPVRRLLERSLRKDQKERLRDVGDVRNELSDALRNFSPRPSAVWSYRRIAVAGFIAAVILGAAAYLISRRLSDSRTIARSTVDATFSQVTSSPGIEWFPSISSDGKWVVYAGDSAGNRDIYLQSITGTTPINLTKDSLDDDDEPAFSPDGEQIAFRSSRDGGGIFVMGRTGEAVRRITRMGFKPTWSADGKQLAFTTEDIDINPQNGRGPSALWVVAVESGEQRSLNVPGAVLASWSPHGNRIAYSIRSNGTEEIWTLPPAGGPPALVVTGTGSYWNPAWSPDGTFVYFSSDRGGSMNLWRVPIDEQSGRILGDPQPLSTPAPFAAHASMSADGARIAYSSVLQTTNIQRVSLDSSTGSVKEETGWITTGSRAWSSPDPSFDGQWVTFYSRIQPEGHIYVARADGSGLREVTGDAALDRMPRWSPDGNWIAFFSNRSGPYQLWKIRPDGSDLQQITDLEGGGMYTAWSPDGSSIAATAGAVGRATAPSYIFDATRPWKGQTPRMLAAFEPPEGYFIVNMWSPNGELIAGTAGLDGKGVAIYSLRSNRYERLTDYGEWPVWFPDSRRILFVSGGKDFFVVDSQTKQVRKIYSSTRDVLGPPRLTRDGREMYFSRRVTESDVWTLTLK